MPVNIRVRIHYRKVVYCSRCSASSRGIFARGKIFYVIDGREKIYNSEGADVMEENYISTCEGNYISTHEGAGVITPVASGVIVVSRGLWGEREITPEL